MPSASADIFFYEANACTGTHGVGFGSATCVGANGLCHEYFYDGQHSGWNCEADVNRGHVACINHSGDDDQPEWERYTYCMG